MPPDPTGWEPRRGGLVAAVVFIAAALTLCWPMLGNEFIGGPYSDQYNAGYAFRNFAAEYWRTHRAIPLWNPYIFGGMPFVGGMHGDIFYPTAWLRWILPTGLAMNLGFALHIVLAGVSMYALLRGLRTTWAGAVVGGLAYELTGIVASLVNPGHDGKLFVSALAPFLFLALLKAIRHRSTSAYGAVALVVGLSLHGHPQMSYYLLVAGAIWAAWLVWGDESGPKGVERYRAIAFGAGAVTLGVALYAVQALPFAAYIPFSPRAAGGPSSGWEYATGYAFPPAELWSLFYPQLNGMIDSYTGGNGLKHHSEFLGAVVILLATASVGSATHRKERWVLGGIAALFLLVAFGGHTPFYRLWYEIMPRMKQVRAAGMAFYLVALPVGVFAGLGAERLLRGEVPIRRLLIGAGVFAVLGFLGAVGGLRGLAEAVAHPQLVQQAIQNDVDVRAGGLRLLIVALASGAVFIAVRGGRLAGGSAVTALALVLFADLWSVDRKFFVYAGPPAALFGGDQITAAIRKAPLPHRVWDPKGPQYGELGVYPGSWLMGAGVPQVLGYHGNELRNFDELWGGKNLWANQVSPALLRLYAVRFVTLREPQALPGFHQVLGPVTTTARSSAVLYEADSIPPYVRLMAGAVKAPEAQIAQIVADPRFPALEVAVYPESDPVAPQDFGGQLPSQPTATASLSAWDAGAIRVAIQGRDERKLYLVVAENWYQDWRVTVDGTPAKTLRAQHSMLSVEVPPGAREVVFDFHSPEYQRGKLISLLALLGVAALMVVPGFRKGSAANA
jgi:hypothetical protein